MTLGKYSIGIGDRFGHQGVAQVRAVQQAQQAGADITPVWNKSAREHQLIGTTPADTRRAADAAVHTASWGGAYFVDADHITLATVDDFLADSDFFTIDVAHAVGQPPEEEALAKYLARYRSRIGTLSIPDIEKPFSITEEVLEGIGQTYLAAAQEAGRIYRHIADRKGVEYFITEVSLDEVAHPQTPIELFFILSMLAHEGVPVQSIAPRFSGQFLKGIDYVGDSAQFADEFAADLAVVQYAVREFNLPGELKLSVHSGSDKFAIYPLIYQALQCFDAGVHLKTAGTTWLEELIGLAQAEDDGLKLAKEIYAQAWQRRDELCAPYATVIAIDTSRLPAPEEIMRWNGDQFASALRHDQSCTAYNPHLRQLLHVAFKVAAEMGQAYTQALERHADIIGEQVCENLYARHIAPLFLGRCPSEVR